ncbi:MAG TPA: hypothetical protein VG944_19675 [Fimbriimonas sp.]|nr:hypothetical protein [Fimbriimonas sp.]
MTKPGQRLDQKLEILALGHPPQREDWLQDIRLRMGLMFIDAPKKDLSTLLGARLKKRAGFAMSHLERMSKSLEGRPEGFQAEAARLREAVERSATIESGSGSTLAEAFLDDMDVESQGILGERQALQKEWTEFREAIGAGPLDTIGKAQKTIEQAFLESGSDRGSLFREARAILTTAAEEHPAVHPVLWLYLGWTVFQITESPDEVAPLLKRVCEFSYPSVSAYFAYRLLAHFEEAEGAYARGYEWLKKAIEMHVTPEVHCEAALSMASLHEPSLAKAHVEGALTDRAGSIVALLADDRILNMGNDLLDVAIRVQSRLRREGRQATSAWAIAAKDVADAQRMCGNGMHVPYELLESHKTIETRLETADIVSAGYLTRFAYRNAKEVRDAGQKALKAEHARRCDALSLSRKAADTVSGLREQKVLLAQRSHSDMVSAANEALAAADAESAKAEQLAIRGFASGLVLFGLYVFSYMVLASRDIVIGLTSPIGVLMMVTTALPVAGGLLIHVAAGYKRSGVQTRVREAIKKAARGLDEAGKEADDFYRDQMSLHRKNLTVVEAELKKAEQALRTLNKPKPAESARVRKKAA